MQNKKTPAEQLSEFLNFINQCHTEYQIASEALNEEDKRLQDLLHEMEFASNKAERNKVATRLQLNEQVVRFFEEKPHRDTLNKMKQLLGRQRKEEEYLFGERVYKQKAK